MIFYGHIFSKKLEHSIYKPWCPAPRVSSTRPSYVPVVQDRDLKLISLFLAKIQCRDALCILEQPVLLKVEQVLPSLVFNKEKSWLYIVSPMPFSTTKFKWLQYRDGHTLHSSNIIQPFKNTRSHRTPAQHWVYSYYIFLLCPKFCHSSMITFYDTVSLSSSRIVTAHFPQLSINKAQGDIWLLRRTTLSASFVVWGTRFLKYGCFLFCLNF